MSKESIQERWKNQLIEDLAKEFWKGYQLWNREVQNLYVPDWEDEDLAQFAAVKGAVLAAAKIVAETQEVVGLHLKEL